MFKYKVSLVEIKVHEDFIESDVELSEEQLFEIISKDIDDGETSIRVDEFEDFSIDDVQEVK